MPEDRYEDRTLPASHRKREESREQGQVARSMDLNSAVILLAAILAIYFFGNHVTSGLMGVLHETLGSMGPLDPQPQDIPAILGRAGWFLVFTILPILIVVLIAALAVSFFQVGFLFTTKPMEPDLNKLNPVSGLQRLISIKGTMRALAGVFKVLAVGVVLFLTIYWERGRLMGLMGMEFDVAARYVAHILFTLSIRAAIALLILALLDYAYQKWQHEQDIRMSHREMREEMKRYEGDPKIRERRRAVQRQMAVQRMMAKVPKATVVVTNPTEISVALEYDRQNMDAPTVVAKGAGHMAQRIREVALEQGVPVIQRPEVARALFRTTEVGQVIPYELYQAVAEILALVYRIRNMAA